MTAFYIITFVVSCLVLVRAGTWVVGSLSRIAQFLGWREFTVAFILMAFASSVPELFVGITSALHFSPELSFGNVVGSNIVNLTLAVAIGVLIAGSLKAEAAVIRRSSAYTAIIGMLPVILILDRSLSRVDGLILLLALVFYFHRFALHEERFTKVFKNKFNRDWTGFKLFLKDVGKFFGGLALLLLAAEGIVLSASFFATAAGISLVIIGALIVALGTNLPEIVFGIKAVTMGHKEMVLGNLMGSVVVNSTLVLGLTALICPLEIPNFSPYLAGILFTVATVTFFGVFSRTGREITKKEGLVLLGIYAAFVLVEFWAG